MNHAGRDRLLPIFLVIVLLAHVVPPAQHKVYHSMKKLLPAASGLAQGAGLRRALSMCPGHDPGTVVLLGLTMRLSYSQDELARGCPQEPPRLFYAIMLAANAVCFVILYLGLRDLLDRFIAFGLCIVYLLSPAARFVLFSGDVYFFPIFAATLMLAALALVRRPGRRAVVLFALCILGVMVCELFRVGSVLAGGMLLPALLAPAAFAEPGRARMIRRRAAVGLAGIGLLMAGTRLALGEVGHHFWHNPHCGLAEFGGYEDRAGRTYPFFVPPERLPPDTQPIDCWDDQREIRLARSVNPDIVLTSSEYERIMRDDLLRVVREYPGGMAEMFARRLWRITALNPWVQHDEDSLVVTRWPDHVARGVWALCCLLGAWCGLPRRSVWLTLGWLPLMLPPLMTHSGYIMYNLPAQVPLYLLGIAGVWAVVTRLGQETRSRKETVGQGTGARMEAEG